MSDDAYDLIVIGSGQGGTPLSMAFARTGHRTLLVERSAVGGTCVNVGCTPTKTMIASARAAYVVQRAERYGVVMDGASHVDMPAVRARTQAMVDKFHNGSEQSLDKAGVEVVLGDARFSGPRQITIRDAMGGERTVLGKLVVIDVGTRSITPSIEGIDTVGALSSTSIMQLDVVPKHLIVMGGGYVGLEFAQLFRRFGSHVTILQHDEHLLPREDVDVSDAIANILRDDGITIVTSATVTRVVRDPNDEITLWYRTDGSSQDERVAGSHLLVSVGRRPNTDTLGVESAGISLNDRGFVIVDERLATSAEGVYAIGDVTGGAGFTHVAYDDYRILRDNLLHGASRTTHGRIIPYAMYTDPQLGRVGMTEREARAAGKKLLVATLPMSRVARALETDETRGFMKAIVDAESGMILGASMLGIDGGETVTVLQVAMLGKLPYTAIRDGMFAHPTVAESLNNLFMTLDA